MPVEKAANHRAIGKYADWAKHDIKKKGETGRSGTLAKGKPPGKNLRAVLIRSERNKIKILLRSVWLYDIIWASRGLLGWCMVFPVSKGLLFQEGGQIRNGFLGIQNVTGGAALLVFSGFQIQDLRLCACLLLQCVAEVIALRITDNNELLFD